MFNTKVFGLILVVGVSWLMANPWPYSLYTDRKGKQIGDVVTILILENAKALMTLELRRKRAVRLG
jgi:flagellar basal body L-ring protein FlgH